MGRAVAGRLLQHGCEVTVWNRTPGKAAEVAGAGATQADSPAGAAEGAEAVLMSLSDDRAVLEVVGQLGGLETGPQGPVLVDMSTVSPETSRRVAGMAPGGRFLAVPIIAAPRTVTEGLAAGLLGGERRLADRLEPLWQKLFCVHWFCGEDPGAATTFKLLNNYLLMASVAVAAEVVATAEVAGLDVKLLREVLDQWPTVPLAIRNRLDDMIGGDHRRGWFATWLGAKDVRLVAEVAESCGLALPIARLVEDRYQRAADGGWREADIAAVVELVRADGAGGRA
jgi:3-hydroxyisobutyrate dehydrogenase-like beta-hydroxyacid dehydrogenase